MSGARPAPGVGAKIGAVVLAAGLGSRLRPYTEADPKCLMEVGGRSIALRARNALARVDAAPVVFVVGYRAAQVRAELGSSGAEFAVNEDFAATGTAWSAAMGLRQLAESTDVDRVLLIEGDVLFDDRLLDTLLGTTEPDATLVEPWRPEIDGSTVTTSPGQMVRSWTHTSERGEDFDPANCWKLVNLHLLSRETAFGELLPAAAEPAHRQRSLEYVLGRTRSAHGGVRAVPTDGLRWVEVDDAKDLERAREMFGGP
ncbi:NTP transferase domain-containing protein [Streptomyces sp. Agncl-13]|uniref:phosphocholine cytidylyltransferase family protein n=1 Tax=Streptomyces sp. Agncl-13 TaxID=3400628 RepID=UPI003A85B476